MTKKALVDLRNYLNSVHPGPLTDVSRVEELLSPCWDDFTGSSTTSMTAHKLDRIEDLRWDPPNLSFIVERHGAIVGGGSSRAEKQGWTANLVTLTATASPCGHRQKKPTQPPLHLRFSGR